jgi:phosphosulfolactate phosphohydrolase-like enzyme
VIEALRTAGGNGVSDVQIVCSGTDGAAALEDVYVAGRVSAALNGPRSDAALVAEAVARGYPTPLEASADARVLRAAGLEHDIVHCALESRLDVVPRVLAAADGVAAVVSDHARAASASEAELLLAVPSTA